MKINIVSLTMLMGGFLMVYGAVKDRNPISIVQTVLTGGTPFDSRKISTGKPPERQDITDPSGGLIGSPLGPGMPGYKPPAPGSGTNTNWEPNSPFPPGFLE